MRIVPAVSALLLLSTMPAAAQHKHHQLGTHEHGRGFLNVAIEGTRVTMEFQAPGSDIVRSESKPNTPQRKAASEAALATLEKPLDLFRMPAAAQCTVVSAKSRMTIVGEGEPAKAAPPDGGSQGKHAHKSGEDHRGHSDYHGTYQLNCAVPAQLTAIDLPYFKAFPRAEKLTIQVIGPKGQTQGESTSKRPSFKLAGAV